MGLNSKHFLFKPPQKTTLKVEIPKIQWYPGHIAKAEKKLSEIINRVDLIIEVRDARIPASTGHRHLSKWIKDKKHLLVMNRSDMVSNSSIQIWTSWFKKKELILYGAIQNKVLVLKKLLNLQQNCENQLIIED